MNIKDDLTTAHLNSTEHDYVTSLEQREGSLQSNLKSLRKKQNSSRHEIHRLMKGKISDIHSV